MDFNNFGEKVWELKSFDEDTAKRFSEALGIPYCVAALLNIRGIITVEAAAHFLEAEHGHLYNPFLLKDMDKAVKRIYAAISSKEKIMIYGDYDVDGVTSVSVLYLYLKRLGARVEYYIPERLTEGYGLNIDAVDTFIGKGISLIITVDTGITASSEVLYANEKGIDVIITDHHECRESIPEYAVAVVNPKRSDSVYPFCELAGVGVVFKLICALSENSDVEKILDEYSDLIAVGTIADVMPLIDENRVIVGYGLKRLEKTENIGLAALINEACIDNFGKKKKISSSLVSYAISPRINAAGRIGKVSRAVELLVTGDKSKASLIATELCNINRERQQIENIILEEAMMQIDESFNADNDNAIILSSNTWHQGVIGIVASRITEKFSLPCILISFDGDIGKGSGRSISGFNINEALSNCKDLLIKYGGHELAAGLSIEKERLSEFRVRFNKFARSAISDEMKVSYIEADMELCGSDINLENAQAISMLEPFGSSNPAPAFFMRDVIIKSETPIGSNKHLKLILEKDGASFTAVYFNKCPDEFTQMVGDKIDIIFNLEINDFKNVKVVQLNIRDSRPCEAFRIFMWDQHALYVNAVSKASVNAECIPDMNSFKAAFIYLRRIAMGGEVRLDLMHCAKCISEQFSQNISPCRLNIILDIFFEMKLINLERTSIYDVKISICDVKKKVNLENSELLSQLKAAI